MKACLFVCVVLAVSVSASLSEGEYQSMFGAFVKTHNKQYPTSDVFNRYNIFKQSVNFINEQNALNRSYTLGITQFADLTVAEFEAQYFGLRASKAPFARSKNSARLHPVGAPQSIDWQQLGKVTPVKDQGQCGSCWAFSAVGAVESAHAIASGQLVSLSEQQLVDCAGSYGNYGCSGGWMDYAFEYIRDHGLCTEAGYPYGTPGVCKDDQCTAAAHITGYTDVPEKDEVALVNAIAQQPVSVAIEADTPTFQFYVSGVITSDACGQNLDHGVLAVGYGTTSDGINYYRIKNSWGASWGEQGYVRLIRDKNECGVALAASYPTGASL